MAVSDDAVAAVRALLAHEWDESRQLLQQLDEQDMRSGYLPLITASFLEAAHRRFRGMKPSDIKNWVAELRVERGNDDALDPNVAEHTLLWAFDQASIDEYDFDTRLNHQSLLLLALLEDQRLDAAQLDAFLDAVRKDVESTTNG